MAQRTQTTTPGTPVAAVATGQHDTLAAQIAASDLTPATVSTETLVDLTDVIGQIGRGQIATRLVATPRGLVVLTAALLRDPSQELTAAHAAIRAGVATNYAGTLQAARLDVAASKLDAPSGTGHLSVQSSVTWQDLSPLGVAAANAATKRRAASASIRPAPVKIAPEPISVPFTEPVQSAAATAQSPAATSNPTLQDLMVLLASKLGS